VCPGGSLTDDSDSPRERHPQLPRRLERPASNAARAVRQRHVHDENAALADAQDDLRVEVAYPNARETTSALLGVARNEPDRLLYVPDPKREPRSFVVTLARPMGQKRGKAEGSFVRETRAQTFDFYRDLVQTLKPWHSCAEATRRTAARRGAGYAAARAAAFRRGRCSRNR
jgi:hypothetical protein